MLLKRFLALSFGLLLFIIFFIAYFSWAHTRLEDRFRQERMLNGVEGMTLTANDSSVTAPISVATPSPAPADSAPISVTPPPSVTPTTDADTNMLIGPVPPQGTTPAATPVPATPPPADSNSAPMAPSTMNFLPVADSLVAAGAITRPLGSLHIPTALLELSLNAPSPVSTAPASTNTVAPSTPAPASTATNAAAAASTSTTNAAPLTAGPARPVPIEASVIVLLYHQFVPAGEHISPKLQWTMNQDVFEDEMKYIHDNGYHVIPMADLLKFLKHEIGLPPNSVVITIDDGYKSAIVYAAPILKKYGYPWTYFVYPDFITVNEGKGAASWNDLLALQADGVDIESHSMTHPMLTKHSQKIKGVWHNFSPEEYDQWLTTETAGSKALLEQKMGRPITVFAYPYGDYNKQVEAKTIAAGYQAIVTVADNPVHATTNPFSIGRYTITQSVIKNFTAYLRQGALGVAEADPAPGATISDPRPVITAVLGYAGMIDPTTIETSVRDFGVVRHDYDPKTSTLRLYLPRDLVQPVNLVNIRVKDAQSGQVMVANWHFNYQPATTATDVHAPISATNAAPILTNAPSSKAAASAPTNAVPMTSVPVTPVPATSSKPAPTVPTASSKTD